VLYFSRCVQNHEQPEPSGYEGLADVRVIQAIYRSANEHTSCLLEPVRKTQRPTPEQEVRKPTPEKADLVHTESPSF
jgi:hypothetical protein